MKHPIHVPSIFHNCQPVQLVVSCRPFTLIHFCYCMHLVISSLCYNKIPPSVAFYCEIIFDKSIIFSLGIIACIFLVSRSKAWLHNTSTKISLLFWKMLVPGFMFRSTLFACLFMLFLLLIFVVFVVVVVFCRSNVFLPFECNSYFFSLFRTPTVDDTILLCSYFSVSLFPIQGKCGIEE